MEAYELARIAFTKSIENYGEDARSRFNLGLTWYYRERWEKALKEFELALKLDPKYKEAKRWCKKCQSEMNAL